MGGLKEYQEAESILGVPKVRRAQVIQNGFDKLSKIHLSLEGRSRQWLGDALRAYWDPPPLPSAPMMEHR